MGIIYKSFLFLGDKTEYWSPFLSKYVKGFLGKNIFFYPKKMVSELNRIFNLLYISLINKNATIWIVDEKQVYKTLMDKYCFELTDLNIFYVTDSLPKGFLSNGQCLNYNKIAEPNLVFFASIMPGDFLLKDLKSRGILSLGLSAGWVDGLDYNIYGNNNDKELFLIVLYFLLIIRYYHKKNWHLNNEEIKV